MIFNVRNNQKVQCKSGGKPGAGFTLIETIIYLVLFIIIIGGGMVATYQVIQGTEASYNHVVLQEEANFLLRKIQWALTGATVVSATSSSLVASKPNVAQLTFDVTGGNVRLQRESNTPVILNSSTIAVSNVSFVKTVNPQCSVSDPIGGLFCKNNNVYKNYQTYICENPSSCTANIFARLQQTCTGGQICSNATCNSPVSPSSPSIDIKINGQDGTLDVPGNFLATITWTSSGVQRCNTGTSVMPDSGWGSYIELPVAGSHEFTVTQSGTFGIQCSETIDSQMIVNDSVAAQIVVISPACSADSSHKPDSITGNFTLTTLQNGRPATQDFSFIKYLRK
jgi:Tfp pilus assembly protein PilV